jgi:hypothetical protein
MGDRNRLEAGAGQKGRYSLRTTIDQRPTEAVGGMSLSYLSEMGDSPSSIWYSLSFASGQIAHLGTRTVKNQEQ